MLLFPHIVENHRERFRYDSATDAFRISVVPRYAQAPKDDVLTTCKYQAFLAYKDTNRQRYKVIARGRVTKDIAAAAQSLLVLLGAILTRGKDSGKLISGDNVEPECPFGEEWGFADSVELRQGRTGKGFKQEDPVQYESSAKGHRERKRRESGSERDGRHGSERSGKGYERRIWGF